MKYVAGIAVVVSQLLVLHPSASAAPVTIDFESLGDLTAVTSQFLPDVAFSNTVSLVAGLTLFELEFPPASGTTVASDDSGPILITFGTQVASVSGLFTYSAPITMTAFDASNMVLGTVSSAFGNNLALSGDAGSSPNELLQLAFASGIASLSIYGSPIGGSFVLDDLIFDVGGTSPPIPEPATLTLLVVGLGMIVDRRRRTTQNA